MTTIKLEAANGGQAFNIYDERGKMGEMVISMDDVALTVYHTEVSPQAEGKGYAKLLLEHMTAYARENTLKVIPLCPYVHAQFKRHPEQYGSLETGLGCRVQPPY